LGFLETIPGRLIAVALPYMSPPHGSIGWRATSAWVGRTPGWCSSSSRGRAGSPRSAFTTRRSSPAASSQGSSRSASNGSASQ
jgi:hypothetical protein